MRHRHPRPGDALPGRPGAGSGTPTSWPRPRRRHPEFPDRFFNVGFAIDPNGEIILKHYKLSTLYPVEHSVTPHDVWDKWIELYGQTLDAFFPVADTEIGRLGVMMANEGSYPGERARAGDERRRGRLPRLLPAPAHRQRVLRDPEPGAGARQQLLRRGAEPGDLLPDARLRHPDRHLRRALADRRLQGADRRAAPLRGRLDLRGRHDRHRRAALPPHPRPVGQLDEGPPDRDLPARLRGADLPEEPLPGPRAVQPRRVPARGHREADRADDRARTSGSGRILP